MSPIGPEPPRRSSAFVSVIGGLAAAPAAVRRGRNWPITTRYDRQL